MSSDCKAFTTICSALITDDANYLNAGSPLMLDDQRITKLAHDSMP
jgi:hypothetical protein